MTTKRLWPGGMVLLVSLFSKQKWTQNINGDHYKWKKHDECTKGNHFCINNPLYFIYLIYMIFFFSMISFICSIIVNLSISKIKTHVPHAVLLPKVKERLYHMQTVNHWIWCVYIANIVFVCVCVFVYLCMCIDSRYAVLFSFRPTMLNCSWWSTMNG